MKILISGSEGFIGINLVKNLLKKKIKVEGFGRSKKKSSIKYNYYKFNLLSKKFPLKLEKYYDTIIHAAGLTSHYDIVKNKNFENNTLKISQNILKLFIKTKSKHLIFLSSGKVYKNNKNNKITIKTKTAPTNKLGKTKLKVEKLLSNNLKTGKLTILRIFLVYGKKQNKKMLIPEILDQIKKIKKRKQKNLILGNVNVKRDFIFIKDLTNLIVKNIFQKPKNKINIKNLASGHSISPLEIASSLIKKYKINTNIVIKKSKIRLDEADIEKVYIKNKSRNFNECLKYL